MLWLVLITVVLYVLIVRISNRLPQRHTQSFDLSTVDKMEGLEFERFTAQIYANLGYSTKVTQAAGDFGADVIAHKNGKTTAIQCKRYSGAVGITAVQEVIGSLAYYKADQGAVVTNSHFTSAAKELARRNNVQLIDRKQLEKLIKSGNKTSRNEYSRV